MMAEADVVLQNLDMYGLGPTEASFKPKSPTRLFTDSIDMNVVGSPVSGGVPGVGHGMEHDIVGDEEEEPAIPQMQPIHY